MPRDARLYTTFPIDMHRHPKITRLDPAVRWTFIEMNGEARIADNDGTFAAEDAEFMWPVEHLTALVNSHPTRPLVLRVGDTYVIRDYVEHQLTRAAREDLSAKRAEAGRKSGEARRRAREARASNTGTSVQQEGTTVNNSEQSQSQSQSYKDPNLTKSVITSNKRAREMTDSEGFTLSEETRLAALDLGVKDLSEIMREIDETCNVEITDAGALEVVRHVLSRAKEPQYPGPYVIAAIRNSPVEIRNLIDWAGLEP